MRKSLSFKPLWRRLMVVGLLALLAAAVQGQSFRSPDQSLLWYLTLDTGLVVIELNPTFAPKTVAQIQSLTRAGVYDGQAFYRVIDGFVAQGGVGEAGSEAGAKVIASLPMESVVAWSPSRQLTPVQQPDMFAPATAFYQGFAVGLDAAQGRAWLLHCPGAVGLSRANEPDSGSSDFYIVIGQAPRYLDRIMTVFGRVVWGMDKVQKIRRADPLGSGIIAPGEPQTQIIRAVLGSDLTADLRLALGIENTEEAAFVEKLSARRLRDHPFFFKKPPAVLDACQVPIAVTLNGDSAQNK